MMSSKTMRLFALAGLLVPVVSHSMDTVYSATHSMIGSDSTSNASAGSKSTGTKSVTRSSQSRFSKPVSGSGKKIELSWKATCALVGAIALPASIASVYFGSAKYLDRPFNLSLWKTLAWAAVGSISGFGYGYIQESRAEEPKKASDNDASEVSEAYHSAIKDASPKTTIMVLRTIGG